MYLCIIVLNHSHSDYDKERCFWLSRGMFTLMRSLNPILCIPPPKITISMVSPLTLRSAVELSRALGIFFQYSLLNSFFYSFITVLPPVNMIELVRISNVAVRQHFKPSLSFDLFIYFNNGFLRTFLDK